MTLNAGEGRNEYTAAAGQTVFNYTFKIYESTDLNVYVTPDGDDCGASNLTTAYTVTGVGDENGGTVVLNSGATLNDLVTIVSDIPTSRTTDYQNNGDFRPDTVNDDLDRVVSLVKQVEDVANRSLQFPECKQEVSALTLPDPVGSQFLRWKPDLSGLENVESINIVVTDADVISTDSYPNLRALLGSGAIVDGQPVQIASTTNTGINGDGVVVAATGSEYTDNGTAGGTIVVANGGTSTAGMLVWKRNYSREIYASWSDYSDYLTLLTSLDTLCRSTGDKLIVDISGSISDTVRMHTGKYEMDFTGSVITSNKTTLGYAFEFACDDDGVTLPTKNTVYEVKGFYLQEGTLGTGSNLCDGLSIGRQSDQTAGQSDRIRFVNTMVVGAFSYSLVLLDELFISSIENPYIDGGYNGDLRILTQSNAGENINIHGGVLANAHNATNTGVNLLMDTDSNADVYLNGTSIDYGDKQIVMRSGAIHGTAHIEGNSAATDIELIETNSQPITLNLSGGTIATGPNNGVGVEEPADGKSSRIEITGTKINCSLTGVGNSLRDKFDTEVITVNSGTPIVKIDAPFYDTSVNKPAILSRYLNRVYDGDFESASSTFWSLNGTSGASITNVATQAYDGTRSLEFVGTVGGTFSALQTFNLSGQTKQLTRIRVLCTAYTSGSFKMILRFFDNAGNLTGTRTSTDSITATTAGVWSLIADTSSIPANVSVMEVQLNASSFIGTCYADDVVCNVF